MENQQIKVAVDAVVFGYHQQQLHVLLIKQKFGPFKNTWSIVGGFVHNDEGLLDAIKREIKEETNLDINQTIGLPGSKGKVDDFIKAVQASENKNILSKEYVDIANHEIPRYYMQVRYGSTYSKVKHIRVFSYFADAILFPDGALWRDA